MKRVLAAVTAATAAAAATVAAAGIVPAVAAPRPAARHAPHPAARQAAHPARPQAMLSAQRRAAAGKTGPAIPPSIAVGQAGGGAYVAVVKCHGADTPPPIPVTLPGSPQTAAGSGPAAPVLRLLAKPKAYAPVYTCTVVVSKRLPAPPRPAVRKAAVRKGCELAAAGTRTRKGAMCTRVVTLNTGFGGAARRVAAHRPRR